MASSETAEYPTVEGDPPGSAGCRWSVVVILAVVPLAFTREAYDPALYTKLIVVMACSTALAVSWAWWAWKGHTVPGAAWLDLPVLIYAAATGLAYLASINTVRGGVELAKVAAGVAIYFSVSRCASPRDLTLWSRVNSVTLAVVSAIGIAQYLGIGHTFIPTAGIPSSTLFFRNFAAMYLVLALPLAAVPFLLETDTRRALVWSVGPTLGALLLIYTRTRGAWVGLAGGMLVVGATLAAGGSLRSLISGRSGASFLGRGKVLLVVASMVVLIAGSQVRQHRPSDSTPGLSVSSHKVGVAAAASSILSGEHGSRPEIWRRSLGMILDFPLAGVGLANWEVLYPAYAGGKRIRPGFVYLRPHNDYIWIAAELGLPALAVFLGILVAAVILAGRHTQHVSSSPARFTLVAAAIGVAAVSGHALFSFPRERPTAVALLWLLLGIVSSLVTTGRRSAPGRYGRVAWTWSAVGLALVVCLGGWHIVRGYVANRAYFRGIVARAEGRWEDAAGHVDQAVAAGVYDYRYLLQKSEMAQHLGRTEEALRASELCLDYHPNAISAWYNIGQLRAALGDYTGAGEALVRTVSLDPDNGQAYGRLGVVYRRLGQPDSARAAYERALELLPNDGVVLYNAAGFYREQKDIIRAQAYYVKSVRSDSTFTPAIRGLAETHHRLGAYAEAAAAYRAAIWLDAESAEGYYGLGLALERLGDRAGARRAYSDFLRRWTGDPAIAKKVGGYIDQLGLQAD